jgi:hypothetical protein
MLKLEAVVKSTLLSHSNGRLVTLVRLAVLANGHLLLLSVLISSKPAASKLQPVPSSLPGPAPRN